MELQGPIVDIRDDKAPALPVQHLSLRHPGPQWYGWNEQRTVESFQRPIAAKRPASDPEDGLGFLRVARTLPGQLGISQTRLAKLLVAFI